MFPSVPLRLTIRQPIGVEYVRFFIYGLQNTVTIGLEFYKLRGLRVRIDESILR